MSKTGKKTHSGKDVVTFSTNKVIATLCRRYLPQFSAVNVLDIISSQADAGTNNVRFVQVVEFDESSRRFLNVRRTTDFRVDSARLAECKALVPSDEPITFDSLLANWLWAKVRSESRMMKLSGEGSTNLAVDLHDWRWLTKPYVVRIAYKTKDANCFICVNCDASMASRFISGGMSVSDRPKVRELPEVGETPATDFEFDEISVG